MEYRYLYKAIKTPYKEFSINLSSFYMKPNKFFEIQQNIITWKLQIFIKINNFNYYNN